MKNSTDLMMTTKLKQFILKVSQLSSPVALLLNKTTAKTMTLDTVQHADWHAINTKQKQLNKKRVKNT